MNPPGRILQGINEIKTVSPLYFVFGLLTIPTGFDKMIQSKHVQSVDFIGR